jgi:phosphate transport system substrate-binding protein
MKNKGILTIVSIALLLGAWVLVPAPTVYAQEVLKYACSNQVYTAFSKEAIAEFTQATGIEVNVKTAASGSCTYRLITGNCDIASTARKLYKRHAMYGYKDFAFCKDPIAVIAKKGCGIDSLSADQLQDIFAGDIKNWKEVGGADLPIIVIVAGRATAAHKNFRRQVMKHKDIAHDFMAYTSTMVIEAVKYFPCGTVSFLSRGASMHSPELKTIKIDGLSPGDKDYPYYQIFYYVTNGEPTGTAKRFIDFTFSDQGAKIIQKYGMVPLSR